LRFRYWNSGDYSSIAGFDHDDWEFIAGWEYLLVTYQSNGAGARVRYSDCTEQQ
jgi:hypothetical protein